MASDNATGGFNLKLFQAKNGLITLVIFCVIILSLTITTIIFAVLWSRSKSHSTVDYTYAVEKGTTGFPVRLPNDGKYVQWTILQLNDVYEMLPLDEGRKGGLARVARVRQLLIEENVPTITVLAGDFLSPSALSQSKVNGTILNGKQMIAVLNTLGLDFVTFGNHEFDLSESELITRMNESNFSWICSNLFVNGSDQPFSSSIRYKRISIDKINILFIGLTIDSNQPYIQIINQTSLISFVKEFLQSLSYIEYDILIALTHLPIDVDIQLAENLPQIDFIIGGHEHEDFYFLRGSNYIPITKADANAFTVYIHRCALNLNTKQFRISHTLTKITADLEDEPKTAAVAKYWYDLGMKSFEEQGFLPNEIVSCLSSEIQLDGRAISVRNFATLLTNDTCTSLLQSTASNGTTIAVFNSGSIRIDDVLKGKITQYDVLRIFPFRDKLFSLSIPGKFLINVLTDSMTMKGSGTYPIYCGINTPDQGKTWLINGKDITESTRNYNVVVPTYLKRTRFTHPTVIISLEFNITQTEAFIHYLKMKYPPC